MPLAIIEVSAHSPMMPPKGPALLRLPAEQLTSRGAGVAPGDDYDSICQLPSVLGDADPQCRAKYYPLAGLSGKQSA